MDKVVHFEIPVDDLDRAKGFYNSIFGWKLEDFPGMEYTGITTVPVGEDRMPTERGAINGGFMARTAKLTAPNVTIAVASIDEALGKVETNGGSIVTPRTEIGDMGSYAHFTDSEGNVVGLWQNAG